MEEEEEQKKPQLTAEEAKAQGNEEFKQKNYLAAINLYT